MRVLIIGGSGHLGIQLAHCAVANSHRVAVTYRTRYPEIPDTDKHQLDLRDPKRTRTLVDQLQPELIINAAFRQGDWASTAMAPANLAITIAGRATRLVHVSSDAIFSGSAVEYRETALPDPMTPYGAAKAAAETAVAAICPAAVIARTSLIIGHGRSSHERLVHRLATGQQSGTLFTDDFRCPVQVDDLAAALLELGLSSRSGVHHIAGADAVSRYELGTLIAQRDGLPSEALQPSRRADRSIPGALAVRLNSAWTQGFLGVRLRGAREFLGTGEA